MQRRFKLSDWWHCTFSVCAERSWGMFDPLPLMKMLMINLIIVSISSGMHWGWQACSIHGRSEQTGFITVRERHYVSQTKDFMRGWSMCFSQMITYLLSNISGKVLNIACVENFWFNAHSHWQAIHKQEKIK